METKIFKYTLQWSHSQNIKIPRVFRPLSVQLQRGEICLWALVDPEAELQDVDFFIVGTGHSASHVMVDYYVGTFQYGELVGHLFYQRR